MVHLLHIDTSGDVCTVGIGTDGQMVYVTENAEARNHAAFINMAIAHVLGHCGLTFADLAGVAVCAGPGSYTGLRIGLATAKGICYATDKPLFLQDRLALMAFSAMEADGEKVHERYMPVMIARTGEYFAAVYDASKSCLVEPAHFMEHELIEVLFRYPDAAMVVGWLEGHEAPELMNGRKIAHYGGKAGNWWSEYAFRQYNCNLNVKVWDAAPLYLKQVYTHKQL